MTMAETNDGQTPPLEELSDDPLVQSMEVDKAKASRSSPSPDRVDNRRARVTPSDLSVKEEAVSEAVASAGGGGFGGSGICSGTHKNS